MLVDYIASNGMISINNKLEGTWWWSLPNLRYYLGICLKRLRESRKEPQSSSSSLAQKPLVGPGLLKKLCPFVSVEGDFLPIVDP